MTPATAPPRSAGRGAVAGVAALLVFLGVAEVVAVAVGSNGAPTVAIGQAVIAHTPSGLREFAIAHFGENDKTALLVGIYVVLAVVAIAVGVLAVVARRRSVALAAMAVLGVVAAVAGATRPTGGPLDAIPSLAGAAAGGVAFVLLVPRSCRRSAPVRGGGGGAGAAAAAEGTVPAAVDRRRFLAAGAAFAGAGAAALVVGRSALQAAGNAVASRAAVRLPVPFRRGAVKAGTDLGVPGVPSYITPNAAFYREDTALVVPELSTGGYRLRLHGLVQRPVTWTYQDLLRMPLVEQT
ncbi:MAG: hypothetical protein ACYCUG_17310, partial [Acidimicrobiales bacterium]